MHLRLLSRFVVIVHGLTRYIDGHVHQWWWDYKWNYRLRKQCRQISWLSEVMGRQRRKITYSSELVESLSLCTGLVCNPASSVCTLYTHTATSFSSPVVSSYPALAGYEAAHFFIWCSCNILYACILIYMNICMDIHTMSISPLCCALNLWWLDLWFTVWENNADVSLGCLRFTAQQPETRMAFYKYVEMDILVGYPRFHNTLYTKLVEVSNQNFTCVWTLFDCWRAV